MRSWPSSLRFTTRTLLARLLLLNMVGLLVLVGGILVLNETRQVLTNAYRQNLEAQARLIAGALSQTAQPDGPFQFFEPSLLQRLLRDGSQPRWQLRDAERVMAQARQVSSARLRLYAGNGDLVLDSAHMDRSARVIAKSLPPMETDDMMPGFLTYAWQSTQRFFRPSAPLLSEINAADGAGLEEVVAALRGQTASLQRQSEEGGDILTVAVPVQGYRAIIGALMVSTQPGEIDAILAQERQAVLQLSGIALVVNVLTSLILAATLIVPVRRLAAAMRGFGAHSPTLPGLETIPDYTARGDEIGELSSSLRDMTGRLLDRINTIDRFAADVAHELKNPLTSLHSAVQSIEQTERSQTPEAHAQLMGIIHNDVQRLNRLISDIANATRLDAELNRGASEAFDLSHLAQEMTGAIGEGLADAGQHGELVVRADVPCPVLAQKPPIAQILDNLVSNALSFSPKGGRVFVTTQSHPSHVALIVADEGPGLAPDTQERIFERFYTDRANEPQPSSETVKKHMPQAGHSGLGLSISRQIARAHGGDLLADNRPDGSGAYFTLTLPRAVSANKMTGASRGSSRRKT
jgi:two-component system sensor histidine kinase ChvG